jgi:hypothetical protein
MKALTQRREGAASLRAFASRQKIASASLWKRDPNKKARIRGLFQEWENLI